MQTFTPQLDILPQSQRTLWPQLSTVSTLGYVLYGGTAIALRLGHRPSVDFDFFSDRILDKPALTEACPFIAQSNILQNRSDTLTVLVPSPTAPEHATDIDEVKLSFFGEIGFGRIGVPEMTTDGVAQVASIDDLLATKLKALLQRVEAKDYIDIATLLKHGAFLDRGLAGAQLLFGSSFQPSECLRALVYFQGGNLGALSAEIKRTLIESVAAVGALPQLTLASSSLALPTDAA